MADRQDVRPPARTEPAIRAKAFARLLAHGLASSRAIVEWLDALIVQAPIPHEALIEAALSEKRRGDLIASLHRFAATSGEDNAPAVLSTILCELNRWFRSHPADGPRVARFLFEMAVAGEYPDAEAEGEMYMMDDVYELAATGVHGTRDDADEFLRGFLRRYAT